MTVDDALAAADAFAAQCRELGTDPAGQVGNVLAAEARRLREDRVDAERFRWLAARFGHSFNGRFQLFVESDAADIRAAIDDAMGGTPCEQ